MEESDESTEEERQATVEEVHFDQELDEVSNEKKEEVLLRMAAYAKQEGDESTEEETQAMVEKINSDQALDEVSNQKTTDDSPQSANMNNEDSYQVEAASQALACKGDRSTWNAGYGLCPTYTNYNKPWCHKDWHNNLVAADMCSECGKCGDQAPASSYVGCFNGGLAHRPIADPPTTPAGVQTCKQACASRNYKYFGFECPHSNTVHCECGNTIHGAKIDDSKCLKFNPHSGGHCNGAFQVGTYAMGAGHIGSVYQVKDKYVGCYNNGLTARPIADPPTTTAGVQTCKQACASRNYKYFGFECPHSNTVHCECGNTIPPVYLKLDDSDCLKFNPFSGSHCNGAFQVGTYAMGSANVGSVYKVKEP